MYMYNLFYFVSLWVLIFRMPSDKQTRMLMESAQKNNHLQKEIYEVASISNDRVQDGEKQYFVRWQIAIGNTPISMESK